MAAPQFQVTCINKHPSHYEPHERIQRIGGRTADGPWTLLEDEAIDAIKKQKYTFYVLAGGRMARVIVATHNGREYLKTETDGYAPDNLLNLPECR